MAKQRIWLGALYGLYGLCGLFWVSSNESAFAQGFRWPEEPENLKVLPGNVKGSELGSVMRGFATALGVRCQFCHAAREGQELDPMDLMTFDFPSDANPMKEKARTMIQMVRAINETHLRKLDVPDSERLEVSCVTCHHGLEKPRQLEDVLAGVLDSDGVEAAVETYHELREQHHGSSAYNFRAGVLGGLGERLMGEGQLEAAIEILALENEQNPNFAYGHYLSATAYEKAGELEVAIEHMQKAVDLAPPDQKPFFSRGLEELKQASQR